MTKDVTAYQYYNKDAKRRTQVNVLDELFPELPNEKYDVESEYGPLRVPSAI